MAQEAYCETHGPYDARLGSCPYCSRQSYGRPQPPPMLDGEEPTDPWGARGRPTLYDDDLDQTDPRAGRRTIEDELDVTELPSRFRGDAWGAEADDATVVDRPAKTGLMGWLVIKEGTRRGQIHEISNGTVIGRGGRDYQPEIMIRDPKISRQHARLNIEDDKFVLWDFGSENGTFVNGQRIRSATPLQENDVIKMGDTLLVLKTLD